MRILIVDDNRAVRRGITAILALVKDWQVCGEAENGMEAIQKTRQLLPDLILVDVSMPGMDGLQTTSLLRKEFPETKILVLSQHDSAQLLPEALAAGANGCADKARVATDLVTTIKDLA